MGEKTKIQWTATLNADGSTTEGASWNPIRARNKATGAVGWHCTKPSAGCKFCYAESINKRLGTGLSYIVPAGQQVEIFVSDKILEQPLHWKKPRKIFPCSMTDAFGEFVADDMIDRMLGISLLAPQHIFQYLTKRSGRMREHILGLETRHTPDGNMLLSPTTVLLELALRKNAIPFGLDALNRPWPLRNCWLGFSAENQDAFNERWAEMEPLARKGWLVWCSYEPSLGPIDMRPALAAGLRWVVIGGESGPGARSFDIQWARDVIAQCKEAAVLCFLKQLGAKPIEKTYTLAPWKNGAQGEPGNWSPVLLDRKGGSMDEWEPGLRVREFPA